MPGIGEEFLKRTCYSRSHPFVGSKPKQRAEPFKEYKDARKIKLEPATAPESSLWNALKSRRSRRDFTSQAIGQSQLALLLWACQGVTEKVSGFLLRTSPSAGALYPLETYLVVNRVEGIDPGIYHFNILTQELELVKAGDFSRTIKTAALGQDMCSGASVVFVWSAIFARSTYKYSDRAYRYLFTDAGHICQNLYLACEDLGLGCCAVGAFFDDAVDDLIGLNSEDEAVVYLATVGKC